MVGRALIHSWRGLTACGALALVAGCASAGTPQREPAAEVQVREAKGPSSKEAASDAASCEARARRDFMVDAASLMVPGSPPQLIETVSASAYQYSRLFASLISQRTCTAFSDVSWNLPIIAVHGDAHLLQFVVTQSSFGLEDFDRSGFGPSVVDIVRYSVSLHLACREVAWPCDPEAGTRAFMNAYRAALDRPDVEVRVPAVVERLRRQVPAGDAWLTWAESLMHPLNDEDKARVAGASPKFIEQQLAVRPDRPPSFYEVLKAGRLSMGVGSGLERKLLFRIAGPSAAPEDDLIVEARTTTKHDPCDCVWWPDHGRSFQAMMFMSLLGRRMPTMFGFGDYGGEGERQEYWVQAWDPGYRELRLDDIHSQAELVELAEDAANQLAGHFWRGYPEPLRPHQRFAQLAALDLVKPRVTPLANQLANEIVAAWQEFRGRLSATSGTAEAPAVVR